MTEKKLTKIEEAKEKELVPEEQAKEEKIPLRKRIGARLMSDEPIISSKVKKIAAVAGGVLVTAGGVIGGIALKEHLDADTEIEPAGLLPEGEAPFELAAEDFVEVESAVQA